MQAEIRQAMQFVTVLFEMAGVAAIIVGLVAAVWRAADRLRRADAAGAYETLRATFGRSVLLGLEILVAADLIRTIALEPTLANLAVLAALVGIRTFLSWSLEVEIDGRWPWQRATTERTPRTRRA